MSIRRAQLVQRVVEHLWPARHSGATTDLNTVARAWGALDVLYRTRSIHGYTEWTLRGPTIQIAVAKSDGRRRSTLAHECWHLLLDPLFKPESLCQMSDDAVADFRTAVVGRVGDRMTDLEDLVRTTDYERLCDWLAIELMLPTSKMPRVTEDVKSVDDLRAVCARDRVSLALMVNRLNEFGADVFLVRLVPTSQGEWLVAEATGLPKLMRGRVSGTRTTVKLISDLPRTRGGDFCRSKSPLNLELESFDHHMTAVMTVSRHMNSVIALGQRSSIEVEAHATSCTSAEKSKPVIGAPNRVEPVTAKRAVAIADW